MGHSGFEGLLTGHTLVGRYHVDEVIGRGGFAAVYRATDERLGRTVAVKVITHSSGAADVRDDIQRRFQREARAIASLHHPNVVTVYDFGTDPRLGLDFLVMELLVGEVLSDRLRRAEPIPVDEALRILLDAAAGVDAGHRAGLVHRDIKPGNVFLARDEHGGPARVYVVDFGIARFTEPEATQLTHSGRAFLSPAYAAPEQLRGETDVTPAADVFSLGVIGYQMLARERPFRRDRLHAPADAAAGPPPLRERNPAVPAAVAEAIHRAMSDDPAARFADAGAFARALREAAAASPGVVVAAPPAYVAAPAPPLPDAELAPPERVASPAPLTTLGRVEEASHAMPGVLAASPSPEPVAVPSPAPTPVPRVEAPHAAPVVAAAPSESREPISALAPKRGGRRMSPAVFAIPIIAILALVGWLVAGSGGGGTRVADQPASVPAPSTDTRPAGPASGGASPPVAANPSTVPASPSGAASTSPGGQGGETPSGASTAATPVVVPAAPQAPPASPPAAPARTAASTGGGGAERLNREGEALFERGDLAEAAERFGGAVRSAPGNAYYRNNLGWALFQLGRVEDAGRELREAVRLDPARDIAYANIGEVERAKGNVAGAIAAYERFLQLNRDPRRAAIAREKLRVLRGG